MDERKEDVREPIRISSFFCRCVIYFIMVYHNKKKKITAILILSAALGGLLGYQQRLLVQEIPSMEKEEETSAERKTETSMEESTREVSGEERAETEILRGHAAWKYEEEDILETANAQEEPLMRVLLMTNEFESYFHPSVTVEKDGETITYTPESVGDSKIRITSESGTIKVKSLKRASGMPIYEGTLEIFARPEGLVLINEVGLEAYLYQVVPSEMPAYYEKEALKAQAVCARTYAWKQYQEEKLKEFSAHVDDSAAFQVYGNVQGDYQTKAAVDETRGKILCQNGEPIQAYYFSTSAGATSTDEVWEPLEEADYLQSVACIYDASEPWSEWNVFFSMDELNQRIQEHYGSIGNLVSLEILEKSTGGAVKELRILTDQENRVVHNEYDIRALFSPKGLTITRKDSSTSPGGNILPSAYFTLDAVQGEEGLEGYNFVGGGYGHGVGMSQTAANHMAMEGMTWEDIVGYFFKDITIDCLNYE